MVQRPLNFPILAAPSRAGNQGIGLQMQSPRESPRETPVPNEPAAKKPKILCVDDDETVLLYTQILLGSRFDISIAASGAAGLEMMASQRPDWVVVDYQMPGMDGPGFMRAARAMGLRADFILLTGLDAGILDWEGLSRLGLKGHLRKPLDPGRMAEIIAGEV